MTYKVIFETGASSHGRYIALVTSNFAAGAVDKFIKFLNDHKEYKTWRLVDHDFYMVGGSFRYANKKDPWARIDVTELGTGFILPEEVVMVDNTFLDDIFNREEE